MERKTAQEFKRQYSLQPALAELERVYMHFRPRFPTLTTIDPPRITIQTRGRRKIHGSYGPQRWMPKDGQFVGEIMIAAEGLNRPIQEIAETLLHEMVHADNYAAGIQDVSNFGRYHNKKFKVLAERIGLTAERVLYWGWAHTHVGEALARELTALSLDEGAFAFVRIPQPGHKKQPTRMKKWGCGCTVARTAMTRQATCRICGKPFRYSETDAPPRLREEGAEAQRRKELRWIFDRLEEMTDDEKTPETVYTVAAVQATLGLLRLDALEDSPIPNTDWE